MKNLLFILTFSFLFLFSCSTSSDDESIDDSHPLVGSWVYTDQRPEENYQYSLTYKFNKNLTGQAKRFEIHNNDISNTIVDFTWIADTNQLTISVNGDETTAGYFISGNELTFSNDEDVYVRQ